MNGEADALFPRSRVRDESLADPQIAELAVADRRFAWGIFVGLLVVALIAVLGDLFWYQRDRLDSQHELRTRVAREARIHAEALSSHLGLLEAELERLAQLPQIDFRDGTNVPEEEVLNFAHSHSALFRRGVVLLDLEGQPVVSEPKSLAKDVLGLLRSNWFQKAAHASRVLVSTPRTDSHLLSIAVPIRRSGGVIGVAAGFVDFDSQDLPGGRTLGVGSQLLVLDEADQPRFSTNGAPWIRVGDLGPVLAAQDPEEGEGRSVSVGGRRLSVAAAPVGDTGLTVVLLADEAAAFAPARGRFVWQLLLTVALQVVTILLFYFYLRSSYRAVQAMEARIAEHQKMAALGAAAVLIAHEVKNALNGLSIGVGLFSAGSAPELSVQTLRSQINRLGHLANSLLRFGRPATAQFFVIPVKELIEETLRGLKLLPESAEVRVTVSAPSDLEVSCDRLLLMTAIDNLSRNAIEAGATAMDLGRISDPYVSIVAERVADKVHIAVRDNAGGLPARMEERLFEPFTSSKPKGIGLGLTMSQRAVTAQGGSLRFRRTEAGSEFVIELPGWLVG